MREAHTFRLDRQRLQALAVDLLPKFTTAEPFPHFIVPDFLPSDIAEAVATEFPKIGDIAWAMAGPGDVAHTNNPKVEKVQCSDEGEFPPLIRRVMHELNSATFLDFLSAATGYDSLVSDPWFGGCGLHSTGAGGRLMIHADEDRHANGQFYQLLNAIYYVTPDWQDEWGGHLELWDEDAKTCVKKIAPKFNSLVVFYTGTKSFHGHPHPLTTPGLVRRNSLAAYYYTADKRKRPDYSGRVASVIWKNTNEHDRVPKRTHIIRALNTALPAPVFKKMMAVWEALKS